MAADPASRRKYSQGSKKLGLNCITNQHKFGGKTKSATRQGARMDDTRERGSEGRTKETWVADRVGVACGRAGDVDAKDTCRGEEGEILPHDVDEMDLGEAKWNVCTPEIVGNGACGRGKKKKEARETAADARQRLFRGRRVSKRVD